jgi:hypothetical protein
MWSDLRKQELREPGCPLLIFYFSFDLRWQFCTQCVLSPVCFPFSLMQWVRGWRWRPRRAGATQAGAARGLGSGCAASRRDAGRQAWRRQTAVVSDSEQSILVSRQNGSFFFRNTEQTQKLVHVRALTPINTRMHTIPLWAHPKDWVGSRNRSPRAPRCRREHLSPTERIISRKYSTDIKSRIWTWMG